MLKIITCYANSKIDALLIRFTWGRSVILILGKNRYVIVTAATAPAKSASSEQGIV